MCHNIQIQRKVKRLFFVALIVSFSACDQESSGFSGTFDEPTTYEGVFIRSAPSIRTRPIDVTVTFNENTFSGTIGEDNYPAICEGTFVLSNNVIEFTNACYWTANFDWSLILSGEWSIEGDLEELTLTKKTGDFTDWYFLKKKS